MAARIRHPRFSVPRPCPATTRLGIRPRCRSRRSPGSAVPVLPVPGGRRPRQHPTDPPTRHPTCLPALAAPVCAPPAERKSGGKHESAPHPQVSRPPPSRRKATGQGMRAPGRWLWRKRQRSTWARPQRRPTRCCPRTRQRSSAPAAVCSCPATRALTAHCPPSTDPATIQRAREDPVFRRQLSVLPLDGVRKRSQAPKWPVAIVPSYRRQPVLGVLRLDAVFGLPRPAHREAQVADPETETQNHSGRMHADALSDQ